MSAVGRERVGGGNEAKEAVHPELKTVIELQQVDLRIAELTLQIDASPSQIQTLETQLSDFLRAHEERKVRLSANQKERRELEAEVQAVQAKISKHKDQLYQVKTNEQYRAMLKEIEGEEENIRKIEDKTLERMLEAEALQKQVQDAAACLEGAGDIHEDFHRLEGEKARVGAEKNRLESARQAAEGERSQLRARRATLADGLSVAVRETYERVARGRRGVAVAEVRDGFCTGCNVRLRPQIYNDIRAKESILTCESCSRILYYVEPAPEEIDAAGGQNNRAAVPN